MRKLCFYWTKFGGWYLLLFLSNLDIRYVQTIAFAKFKNAFWFKKRSDYYKHNTTHLICLCFFDMSAK